MPRLISNGKSNGFPMAPRIASAMRSVAGGLPSGDASVWIRPVKFYHKVDYRAAGPLNNQLTFFNAARSFGITNLENPNALPPNYGLLLESIRLHFVYGISAAGYACGCDGGAPTTAQNKVASLCWGEAGANVTENLTPQWRAAECIRRMMDMGIVTFNVGDRPVFEVCGITSFPSGRGIVSSTAFNGAIASTAAANSVQQTTGAHANGVPVLSNRFEFGTPYPLPAGQTFALKLQWQANVDFTAADVGPMNGTATTNVTDGVLKAGHFVAELEGQLTSPAN